MSKEPNCYDEKGNRLPFCFDDKLKKAAKECAEVLESDPTTPNWETKDKSFDPIFEESERLFSINDVVTFYKEFRQQIEAAEERAIREYVIDQERVVKENVARATKRERERIEGWIKKSFHSNDYVANEIIKFLAIKGEKNEHN